MMNKRIYLWISLIVLAILVVIVLDARTGEVNEDAVAGWNGAALQKLMIPRWFLNSLVLDGEEVGLPEKHLTLQFEEGGQANGEGGCNSFFATYEARPDGKITFGSVGATKMACEDGMEQENAYFNALAQVTQFRTAEGQLTLTSADGKTSLIFNMPPK